MRMHPAAILVTVLALAAAGHSWAEPSKRQQILGNCSKQAKEKSLADDAYAQFMRDCLKRPDGVKPQTYAASNEQKVAPGTVLRPALVQPARTSK